MWAGVGLRLGMEGMGGHRWIEVEVGIEGEECLAGG